MIIYILIGCIFFILVVIIIYIYYYNYYYKKIILDPHNKNNEEYLHTLNEKKPPTEEEIMFNEIKDGLKDLIKTIALFKELDLTFSDLNNIINDSYIAINLYTSIDNIVYHFKGNNIKDEYRNNINKAILKHLQKQIQTTLPIDIITTASSTISSSTSDTIVVSKDIYNAISKNKDSTISNIDNISPEKYYDKITDLLDNSNALKTKIMIDLNTLINADANNNIEIYNTILNYKLNIDLQESKPPIFTIANMDQFKLYNKYIDIHKIITGEINNISDNILQDAISSLNNALKTNTDNMVKNMVKNILNIDIDSSISILQVYDKLKTNFNSKTINNEINKIKSIITITSSTELLNLITKFNENGLTKTLLNNIIDNLDIDISKFDDTASQLNILEIYNLITIKGYTTTIITTLLTKLKKIIDISIQKKTITTSITFEDIYRNNTNKQILIYTIYNEIYKNAIDAVFIYQDAITFVNYLSDNNIDNFDNTDINLLLYNKYYILNSIITNIKNAINKAKSIINLMNIRYNESSPPVTISSNLCIHLPNSCIDHKLDNFDKLKLFYITILEHKLSSEFPSDGKTNIIRNLAILLANIAININDLSIIAINNLAKIATKYRFDYNNIDDFINKNLNYINIIINNTDINNIIDIINNIIYNDAKPYKLGENYMAYYNTYGFYTNLYGTYNNLYGSYNIQPNANHIIIFNTNDDIYNINECSWNHYDVNIVGSYIRKEQCFNHTDKIIYNDKAPDKFNSYLDNIKIIYGLRFFIIHDGTFDAKFNIIFKYNDIIFREYNFVIKGNRSNDNITVNSYKIYNYGNPTDINLYLYKINFTEPIILYRRDVIIKIITTNLSSVVNFIYPVFKFYNRRYIDLYPDQEENLVKTDYIMFDYKNNKNN